MKFNLRIQDLHKRIQIALVEGADELSDGVYAP